MAPPGLRVSQDAGGLLQHLTLGPVRGPPQRVVEGEPPDVLHLVVVARDVAPCAAHEVEANRLADPYALPDIEIGDLAEVVLDLGLEAGLLPHLAHRGLRGILARLDLALGEPPRELPSPRPPGGERDLDAGALAPVDHPPRGAFEAG